MLSNHLWTRKLNLLDQLQLVFQLLIKIPCCRLKLVIKKENTLNSKCVSVSRCHNPLTHWSELTKIPKKLLDDQSKEISKDWEALFDSCEQYDLTIFSKEEKPIRCHTIVMLARCRKVLVSSQDFLKVFKITKLFRTSGWNYRRAWCWWYKEINCMAWVYFQCNKEVYKVSLQFCQDS